MSNNGRTRPAIRPSSMRHAMSRFATGVIVLTVGGEEIHGMTANAFSSVALEPPLVLCCVAHSARMHRALTSRRSFGISVLAAGQQPVARHFADRHRAIGAAEFDGVDWEPGPRTGAPLITDSLAWLECELVSSQSHGDHSIFVGQVLESLVSGEPDSLLFYGGRFQTVTTVDDTEGWRWPEGGLGW